MRTSKTLDEKLARIRAGRYTAKDFIIADAKDGDMALGVGTAGPELDAEGKPTGRMRPLKVYRDAMETMVASGAVDVMLTSLSSAAYLTRRGVYADTALTPAVRLNDGSDIWHWRGADYKHLPTVPFRTARLDRVKPVSDLGLYAVTFFNDLDQDRRTLDAYAAFRDEASAAGVRHFLEVFNPQFEVKTVGADFATPVVPDPAYPPLRVEQSYVDRLEGWCDHYNADLPALRSFILSGGTPVAAHLHVARTVCRRAERIIVELAANPAEPVSEAAIRYMNRLSDFLFVAARAANGQNKNSGAGDVLWVPGASR